MKVITYPVEGNISTGETCALETNLQTYDGCSGSILQWSPFLTPHNTKFKLFSTLFHLNLINFNAKKGSESDLWSPGYSLVFILVFVG